MENEVEVEVSKTHLRVEKAGQAISMEIGRVSEDRREGYGNHISMSHPADELDNRVGQIKMVNWKNDNSVNYYYQSNPPADPEKQTCFIRTSKVELSDESEVEENVEIWLTKEEFDEILESVRNGLAENPEIEFSEKSDE